MKALTFNEAKRPHLLESNDASEAIVSMKFIKEIDNNFIMTIGEKNMVL